MATQSQSKRARTEEYALGNALECKHCRTTTFSADPLSDAEPIQSQSCRHSVCCGCVTRLQVAKLEVANLRRAKWLNCPICGSKKAFDPANLHVNSALLDVCKAVEGDRLEADEEAESSGQDATEGRVDIKAEDTTEASSSQGTSHRDDDKDEAGEGKVAESDAASVIEILESSDDSSVDSSTDSTAEGTRQSATSASEHVHSHVNVLEACKAVKGARPKTEDEKEESSGQDACRDADLDATDVRADIKTEDTTDASSSQGTSHRDDDKDDTGERKGAESDDASVVQILESSDDSRRSADSTAESTRKSPTVTPEHVRSRINVLKAHEEAESSGQDADLDATDERADIASSSQGTSHHDDDKDETGERKEAESETASVVETLESSDDSSVDSSTDSTAESTRQSATGTPDNVHSHINKLDFMSFGRKIFHVNPFISAKKKTNVGFGPFIAAGGATIGFSCVTPHYLRLASRGMGEREIRNALKEPPYDCSSREIAQVFIWQTQVRVGDFVIMRHEYSSCEHTPERLFNIRDTYLGPVYVIGVVTHPPSSEYTDILEVMAKHCYGWTVKELRESHTYCRVDFCRMGYKKDLKESTQSYLGKICQPTIAHICQTGKVWPKLKTDCEQVRSDLWDNSTTVISKDDFAEFSV